MVSFVFMRFNDIYEDHRDKIIWMQDHVPYFIYEANKTMRIQVVLPTTFMSVLVLQLYWMLTRVLKMAQWRNIYFSMFFTR